MQDITFEDVENAVKIKFSHKTTSATAAKSFDENAYAIIKEFGTLSSDQFAPKFSLVNWFGHEMYDLRRWKSDGSPGKGFTFTYDDLVMLSKALHRFDFSGSYIRVIREYHGGSSLGKIYWQIASLSSATSKGVTWKKEVNLADWGYGTKVVFHKWTASYDRCSKGICISVKELQQLMKLIDKIID